MILVMNLLDEHDEVFEDQEGIDINWVTAKAHIDKSGHGVDVYRNDDEVPDSGVDYMILSYSGGEYTAQSECEEQSKSSIDFDDMIRFCTRILS